MASKKYKLLLAGVFMLLATGAFAQTWIYDSTLYSKKTKPQQNEFWNNTYDFPAKPRNQWEIGLSGGSFNVFGDVTSKFPEFGFAAHVRKALGYLFSLRLQYLNGTAKGMNWTASANHGKNPAWVGYSAPLPGGGTSIPGRPVDYVFYNYKNKSQDLSLQGIFTLNNIRFHKAKTGFLFYAGLGFGATVYETKVNARDASGNTYASLFNSVFAAGGLIYENKGDILDRLEEGMDDTYETTAEANGDRTIKSGDNTLRFSTTVLAGMAFKLGKSINLALENRHTFIKMTLWMANNGQNILMEIPYNQVTLILITTFLLA